MDLFLTLFSLIFVKRVIIFRSLLFYCIVNLHICLQVFGLINQLRFNKSIKRKSVCHEDNTTYSRHTSVGYGETLGTMLGDEV